jgi:hypothetical protein
MNMKIYKSLLTLLIVMCFTGLLFAKEKDNYIYIKQYDKIIGKFTPEQYEALVSASDNYKELILAQQEGRVSIQCDEKIIDLGNGEYKTSFKLVWKDKQGNELNYITSELILNIDNDKSNGIQEWRIVYRDISEIGFPICFLLILIIVAL